MRSRLTGVYSSFKRSVCVFCFVFCFFFIIVLIRTSTTSGTFLASDKYQDLHIHTGDDPAVAARFHLSGRIMYSALYVQARRVFNRHVLIYTISSYAWTSDEKRSTHLTTVFYVEYRTLLKCQCMHIQRCRVPVSSASVCPHTCMFSEIPIPCALSLMPITILATRVHDTAWLPARPWAPLCFSHLASFS